MHLEYHISGFNDFLDYVSGERYRRHMFPLSLTATITEKIPEFFQTIWKQYWVISFFSVPGLFAFRRRSYSAFVISAIVGYGIFIMNYTIHDIEVYYIPVLLLFMVLIAAGIWRPFSQTNRTWIHLAKYTIIICTAIYLLIVNFDQNNMSQDIRFDKRIQGYLKQIDSNAVVMLDGWRRDYGPFEGLMYYLYAEQWVDRNIYIADHASARKARRYLADSGNLFSNVMDQDIPNGLALYVVDPELAKTIKSDRITVEMVSRSLFRLRYIEPKELSDGAKIEYDIGLDDIAFFEGPKPERQTLRSDWADSTLWLNEDQILQSPKDKGKMAIRVSAPSPGAFGIWLNLTRARDYGIIDIHLNGKVVASSVDLYSPRVRSEAMKLDVSFDKAGEQIFEFVVKDRNESSKGFGIGLDSITIEKTMY